MQRSLAPVARITTACIGAIRLIHPFPATTVVVTSAGLLFIAHRGMPGLPTLTGALAVVAASQVAVGALNDYRDRADDARVQPDKPLPSGITTPGVALALVVFGTATCTLLAARFGPTSLALVWLGLGSAFLYDLWLKPTTWGALSYIVSFLTLVSWIWTVEGRLSWKLLALYPLGACLLVAAHLANALPDVEVDSQLGHRGLAVVLGPLATARAVIAICAVAGALGIGVALAARSLLALPLLCLGCSLTALAGRSVAIGLDRSARRRLFRLTAPAIASIAAGCLLALSGLW